jgi:dolichyl-diphosphooligosaccharide--protein glycosyltransferase
MVWTCYFWIRSLRNNDPYAYLIGIITGLSYFYMVASWGGYVFLLNLIGAHAAVLVLMGRFDTKTVYRAYTLFYAIGTTLAIQVPVVGYAPIKSLEQLGPCAVFLGYQLLFLTETVIERKKGTWTRQQAYTFRAQVIGAAAVAAIIGAMVLAPTGYFGPLSARVRGLFVKHTKTGNPLVDSVAEHQPASGMAYFQYLHHVCTLAPIGFIIVLCRLSNSSSFLLVWGAAAYFFSHKMVRLILLTAPIGSTLAGLAVGRLLVWCFQQWWDSANTPTSAATTASINPITASVTPAQTLDETTDDAGGAKGKGAKAAAGKKKKAGGGSGGGSGGYRSSKTEASSFDGLLALQDAVYKFSKTKEGWMLRRALSVIALLAVYVAGSSFATYCWRLQHDLSNPTIILKARRRDNVIIKVDDYREAYWWLRDNTPEDSRIMAWWDCKCLLSAKKITFLEKYFDMDSRDLPSFFTLPSFLKIP